MSLRIYNTLSRQMSAFSPAEPGHVRMYVCGMTVYDLCHLGHARSMIAFDVVQRWLKASGLRVTYVRNITDIDDKIIQRALHNGETIRQLTDRMIEALHQDADALGIERPQHEPRATDYVPQMLSMIGTLEQKGLAYRAANGDVNYAVRKFPAYGQLSGKSLDELNAGERVAVESGKHDPLDFVLWKSAKPSEPEDCKWDSAYGQGRPGWHIECSAMSCELLGETFDIHGGGADLQFPHHENEIAQSQCCNGTTFAHHWYHSEHLLVDGKKMSKSLGNLYTLDQLKEMGHSPAALRYALLAGHPRKQLNFTLDSLHAAEKALAQLRAFRAALKPDGAADPFAPALAALNDDLNTPHALGIVFTAVHAGPAGVSAAAFDRFLFALGLDLTEPAKAKTETPAEVIALAEQRWAAKAAKNWAEADRLRGAIAALGWTMLDRKDGYSLEPAKK